MFSWTSSSYMILECSSAWAQLLIQKWRDKREILTISSRHNGDYEEVKNTRGQMKIKPAAVVEYNRYMGGVDKGDQMATYYSTPRKTIGWQLKLFFHFLYLSLWNASFLYNFEKAVQKEKMSYHAFRDTIISNYIDSSINRIMPPPSIAQHFPMCVNPRISCRLCANEGHRSLTWFACTSCIDNKNWPIGLCISEKSDCFKKYPNHLL